MVTIAGGGGTGATAVAQFDSASGSVTGSQVTSPGFGYTSTPAVTLSGGGTNVQTAVGSVTRSANVSGGVTKLGSGMLILRATNTYAGATIVSNGTLRLGVVQALPTNSTVTLAGGSLDLNDLSHALGTVNATGGSNQIVNGSLVCTSVAQSGGVLGISTAVGASRAIEVSAGVMQLPPVLAGLYEGAPVAQLQHVGQLEHERVGPAHHAHGEHQQQAAVVG
jgi:autotransporter-associated beta strand protein